MSLLTEFNNAVRASRKRIAIVGDVLLDCYHPVRVSRISPEYPIPIYHTDDDSYRPEPGGAANVCHQLSRVNAQVDFFGIFNPFVWSKMNEYVQNASRGHSVMHEGCQVPIKKRYYDPTKGTDFPLCRIDIEKKNYGLDGTFQVRYQIAKQLRGYIETKSTRPDVVVFSDYNKGTFEPKQIEFMLKYCHDAGVPTIVDPKVNPRQWKGCTYFKPNESEARTFCPQHIDDAGWHGDLIKLREDVECRSIVMTMAGKGVHVLDGHLFHENAVQTRKVEARSGSGAGDCFAAFFALAVAHGYDPVAASQIAWEAGAVYVQKLHNEPVSVREILKDVDPVGGKIVTAEEMAAIIQSSKEKFVFTNGCYDILHSGHLSTLQFAKSKGDRLIVALNSDASVRRLKGEPRPFVPLEERSKLVAGLSCVDYVVDFDDDTPYKVLEQLRPHVLVKGGDYSIEKVVGTELVDEVYLTELVEGKSTTALVEKIKHVADAVSGSRKGTQIPDHPAP